MTAFSGAHAGDLIQLRYVPSRIYRTDGAWLLPMRLQGEPAPCGDRGCEALTCEAVTEDGRHLFLHRLPSKPIDVLESVSECAGREAEVVAEQADKPSVDHWSRDEDPDAFADRGDYDDTPNDTPEDSR